MILVHEDPDFGDVLLLVARDSGLNPALVEKDYWVTHSLWALHEVGLQLWFKGGTSLSKAFGLIQRFSEDLDLQIDSGTATGLPRVGSWTSTNKGPVAGRRAFFKALGKVIVVPGAVVQLIERSLEADARTASYQVVYPGRFAGDLHASMRPYVLLEVGQGRVHPFESRSLTSFVHEWLDKRGKLGSYRDNRVAAVRCVHPLVTLHEKIDAITRRYPRGADPAAFIRHYEDAARIIQAEARLPPLEGGVSGLIASLLEERRIWALPTAADPAFTLPDATRRRDLERAHVALAPIFWGDRLSLEECCETILNWLKRR